MPEGAPPRDHTDIFGKSQERASNYKTNPDGSVSERLANGAVNEYNRDGDLIPHLSRPARPVQNEIEIPQNIYAEPGRLD